MPDWGVLSPFVANNRANWEKLCSLLMRKQAIASANNDNRIAIHGSAERWGNRFLL
jgi:hypothetical protein